MTKCRKYSFLFLLVVFTRWLFAAPPALINYQGRMRESGQPVSGTKNVVFRLYDDASAGSQVWTSGTQGVQVSTGIFNYKVGSNVSVANLDWTAGPYWLQVEIEGEVLSPRSQLLASAYAFYATSAAFASNAAQSVLATTATYAVDAGTSVYSLNAADLNAGSSVVSDSEVDDNISLETISGTPVVSNGIRIGTDDTNHLIDDATSGAGSATLYIGNSAILKESDVDDTPANGDTSDPISSNWAYDHAGLTDAHNATSANTASRIVMRDADGDFAASTVTVVGINAVGGKVMQDGNELIPSGTVWFFNLSSCPPGWSELTDARGRYIVGLPSGGDLAYSTGTALSNLENRPVGEHDHAISDPGHYHPGKAAGNGNTTSGAYHAGGTQTSAAYSVTYGTQLSETGITILSTGTYTPSVASGTNAPYIQLLICEKD